MHSGILAEGLISMKGNGLFNWTITSTSLDGTSFILIPMGTFQ